MLDNLLDFCAPRSSIWVPIIPVFLLLMSVHTTGAQLMPLPPPSPSGNTALMGHEALNDKEAPIIDVLTTDIHAGKSVFKVRISDKSGLELAQIKYVHDGKIVTTDLVREQGDIYKALIDIQPPSRVIVIDSADQGQNVATVVKEFNVQPAPDILKQAEDFFSGIIGRHQ